MSEECAARAVLRTIMESHKFNVASMRPTDVHALCYAVLNPQEGDEESRETPTSAAARCVRAGQVGHQLQGERREQI
ncbi:hypothetical protein [Hydrogenophaga sp. 2FB]|uniref:hypothetical protein n=1 Tax=Hydrogenophaga sp. 2FB TaxID=2502187 RepID=UPI0010F4FEB5|nr:hypothetical protein [Hydrogenophaga sp. 2FB]